MDSDTVVDVTIIDGHYFVINSLHSVFDVPRSIADAGYPMRMSVLVLE
jgi:hypothetical protein